MIPNLAYRAKNRLAWAMSRKGVAVELRWVEVAGGTVDPTTGATIGGTVTEQSEQTYAFKLEDVAKTMVHHFNNYEEGDCILDLPPAVVIAGREDLIFVVDGVEYQQKQIAGNVIERFETIEGVRLYRTVYLSVRK